MENRKQISVFEQCEVCGKVDATVHERACGYHADLHGTEVLETVCDDCEHNHIMEI